MGITADREDTPGCFLRPKCDLHPPLQLQSEWLTLSSLGDVTRLPKITQSSGQLAPPQPVLGALPQLSLNLQEGLPELQPEAPPTLPPPPSPLTTSSLLGQCQQQMGWGYLALERGKEELATQPQGPQVCSRMGIKCFRCGRGNLRTSRGSDDQERRGGEVRKRTFTGTRFRLFNEEMNKETPGGATCTQSPAFSIAACL